MVKTSQWIRSRRGTGFFQVVYIDRTGTRRSTFQKTRLPKDLQSLRPLVTLYTKGGYIALAKHFRETQGVSLREALDLAKATIQVSPWTHYHSEREIQAR